MIVQRCEEKNYNMVVSKYSNAFGTGVGTIANCTITPTKPYAQYAPYVNPGENLLKDAEMHAFARMSSGTIWATTVCVLVPRSNIIDGSLPRVLERTNQCTRRDGNFWSGCSMSFHLYCIS